MVDDQLKTNDDAIYAIGEAALHNGITHGPVGAGYAMAGVVASRVGGDETTVFSGSDSATSDRCLPSRPATYSALTARTDAGNV